MAGFKGPILLREVRMERKGKGGERGTGRRKRRRRKGEEGVKKERRKGEGEEEGLRHDCWGMDAPVGGGLTFRILLYNSNFSSPEEVQ